MKSIPLIILLLSLSLHCYSQSANGEQTDSDTDKKNSIHATVSLTKGASATASYERVLFKDVSSRHQLFVKGEMGGVVIIDGDEGFIIGPHIGYLNGEGKDHLEIAIGFYMLNSSSHTQSHGSSAVSLRPSALLGYRMQKPGKGFIFRTGFSYPLGVYFGIGVAF